MRAHDYLIEIDAHTGSGVETLRVSTCGYMSKATDTPANTEYLGCVSDPGTFSATLFGTGKTIGESEVGYGTIVLTNVDGTLDPWIEYAFDGRPFVVRRLAYAWQPLADSVVVMRGTVQSLDTSSARTELRLTLYDRRRVLDKPLQESRYAGTTTGGGPTADGTEDLKDQTIPLIYGSCYNVPCLPVNPYDLIYQACGNGYSVIQVYDGGVPLNQGSDYSTVAALQGATVAAGEYATAKNLGLFRLGWSPVYEITADVAEGAAPTDRLPGSVILRMMEKVGLDVDDIDYDSFDDLDDEAPYDVGLYIDSDETALSAINKIASSVGASVIPGEDNEFRAYILEVPVSPTVYITENDVFPEGGNLYGFASNPDTDGNVPVWRIVSKYRRVWTTMETSQTAGCVTDDFRAFLKEEFREYKKEDEDVKDVHLLAGELTIETYINGIGDIETETDRRFALYSVNRRLLVVSVSREISYQCQLGVVANFQAQLGGFSSGRNMIVVGRELQFSSETDVITLWG